ncbi:MAG: hypothetical protein MMC33_008512 [Icmadophila ericetorum]|nr:hypothetical protein [Icmadophila ericetorum]
MTISLQDRHQPVLIDVTFKPSEITGQPAFETGITVHPLVDPHPDGGLRAWSQVLVGHLINALTWGTTASFGVYQLYYSEHLLIPPSQVSWIGSVQVFLTFFIGTFSGRSVDAGYCRHIVLLGSVLLLIGMFTTSLAETYVQIFLAQGLCAGVGMGLVFMPAVTVVGTYFQKRKTMALAISASGSGTGSLVFPATVQYLIPKIGFPWAINTYARDVFEFTDLESVNLLLVVNAVGILIRAPLGYVADRWIGPINTLIPSAIVLGLMIYVWIGIKTRVAMYLFAVVYGLATGATQGIFVGSLASLTKDLSKTGTRFGMVCTFLAFATLAGPPIGGALIQREGRSFVGGQLWAGSATLVGALTLVAARVHETGWTWKVKI